MPNYIRGRRRREPQGAPLFPDASGLPAGPGREGAAVRRAVHAADALQLIGAEAPVGVGRPTRRWLLASIAAAQRTIDKRADEIDQLQRHAVDGAAMRQIEISDLRARIRDCEAMLAAADEPVYAGGAVLRVPGDPEHATPRPVEKGGPGDAVEVAGRFLGVRSVDRLGGSVLLGLQGAWLTQAAGTLLWSRDASEQARHEAALFAQAGVYASFGAADGAGSEVPGSPVRPGGSLEPRAVGGPAPDPWPAARPVVDRVGAARVSDLHAPYGEVGR
jgi:hypothetical protein